ncbi:MAG TPA: DUF11 domain-containing protein [Verrucomicrobiae bacterium]|nr:DUF11 domain-containing protein [Verrucomicrobiae bacterium]
MFTLPRMLGILIFAALALVGSVPSSVFAAPGGVSSGLVTWQKADDGTATGASWGDASGNGNTATQAVAANQPIFVPSGINFNPAFQFTGTRWLDYSSTLGVEGANSFSSSVAFKATAVSNHDLFSNNGGADNNFRFGYGTNGGAFLGRGGGGGTCSANTTTTTPIQTAAVASYTRTSPNATVYLNSATGTTGTCDMPINAANRMLGRRLQPGQGSAIFQGFMSEFVHYSRALTTDELARVQSYSAAKYGATLVSSDYVASDGTVFWNNTANAPYNNNITVIGRDDASPLNQKQSKAETLDSLLTVGNGNTIAADNASNPNNFAADRSFFAFGDNGATTVASGVLSGGAANQVRMGRAWKVQETGTVGSVKIRIPASKIAGTAPVLVRSTDDTFSVSDTLVPLSPDGAGNYEVNWDFSNGDYFTFAFLGAAPGGVFGLTTWQKANDGTLNGLAGTTTWLDSSGNGNTAVRSGGGFSEAGMNFNPGWNFTGNAAWAYTSALGVQGTNNFSSIVALQHNVSANGVYFGNRASSAGSNFLATSTAAGASSVGRGGDGGACGATSTVTAPVGVSRITSYKREYPSAVAYLNGAGGPTGTCNMNITATFRQLGKRDQTSVGDANYSGLMGEFIHYGHALSDAEFNRVNSYVALKYGITLDQTSPQSYVASDGATTFWSATTNNGYNNNITGIGRDDLSALNQKQSKSVNTEGLVTIGHGTIAADNISNPNNFAANNSFLMFGDNNGDIDWTTSGAPINKQITGRTFKVQKTGTVGSTRVQVPDDSSTFATKLSPEVNTIYLLVDTDSDFTSGATIVPMTLNGANWEGDVTLANGNFFAFATDAPLIDLSISKTDDTTAYTPGTSTTYTIVVASANTSLTTATNAPVQDLLPSGITTASWTCGVVTGGATCAQPSGAGAINTTATLPPGSSVTYSITITIPAEYTGNLSNTATVAAPTGTTENVTDNNSATDTNTYSRIEYRKTVTPTPTTPITPGQTFTYTITAENMGETPLTGITVTDDMTDVIDDATYNNNATASDGAAPTYSAPHLSWTGDVAVGATVTITYTVTANNPMAGDGILINSISGTGPASNCTSATATTNPNCFVRLPQPDIGSNKTVVSPTANPKAGETVTYRFTVDNSGAAAATGVAVGDNLAGVLDDAIYNGDATATAGTVTYSAANQQLTWNGDLAADGSAGDSAIIEYSVTIKAADELGDGMLNNGVFSGGCPNPVIFDPANPGYNADCVTQTAIMAWIVTKTMIAPEEILPGDTLTYNLTVENTGAADLTGADAPSISDNMAQVLDDAIYNEDATASAGPAPTFTASQLTWSGDVATDQAVTVSYSVTIKPQSELTDKTLLNTVAGGQCPTSPITDESDPNFRAACVVMATVNDLPPTPTPTPVPSPMPNTPDTGTGGLADTGVSFIASILLAFAAIGIGIGVMYVRRTSGRFDRQ